MHIVPSETVTWKNLKNESGNGRIGVYVGMPGQFLPGPQAYLVQVLDPHGRIRPHFHDVDQFQIIIQGGGVIGKKPLAPVTAHYADAFTPYGPIVSNDQGISFLTMRQSSSSGLWVMPGSRDKMPGRAGRSITVEFATGKIPAAGVELNKLEEYNDGLEIVGIRLASNETLAPQESTGGSQYYLVCAGAIIHNGKTLETQSLMFCDIGEAAPELRASSEGAEVLLLQFPRPSERPGSNPTELAKRDATEYLLPPTIQIE